MDWSQTYATIDEHCRRVSQFSFLDLVEKGFVYNVESPPCGMWTSKRQWHKRSVKTERPGMMHDIRFATEDGGELTIATTRPELLGRLYRRCCASGG